MNNLFPLLLFCLSTTLTPGPNNFLLMNSGLNHGIRKSLSHYLGICIGFPLMVLLVSLGFGELFKQHLWIKHLLKIMGSAYMLYLAYQILFSLSKPKNSESIKPFSFIQAVLFQWINPKAWLMVISASSIFSLTTNYIHNAIIISMVFLLVGLPCIGSWLVGGAYLRQLLKNAKQQKIFNILMALCLIASIILIFLD